MRVDFIFVEFRIFFREVGFGGEEDVIVAGKFLNFVIWVLVYVLYLMCGCFVVWLLVCLIWCLRYVKVFARV